MSARPPATAGLCADCRHAETVSSRRSRFLRCRRSDTDASFARYPALPVLVCAGYEEGGGGGTDGGDFFGRRRAK